MMRKRTLEETEEIILDPCNDRHKHIFKPRKSLNEAKANIEISSK